MMMMKISQRLGARLDTPLDWRYSRMRRWAVIKDTAYTFREMCHKKIVVKNC